MKKHRKRLIRAERAELARVASEQNAPATPTDAHRQLVKRGLIYAHSVDIVETAEHVGTDRERRTARKVVLYLLTLRGLQACRSLIAQNDPAFRAVS